MTDAVPERLATMEYSVALLAAIETNAQEAARNVHGLSQCLQENLREITSLSMTYGTSYKSAALNVDYAVKDTVETSQEFVDKCLVLHSQLQHLESLTKEITEIKRAVNRFEYFADQVLSTKGS